MDLKRQLDQILSAMKQTQAGTKSSDVRARVTRVDGSTVWVKIYGNRESTPAQKTIDCKPGDRVKVRLTDGQAFIIGNDTAPPTDDTTAIQAGESAAAAMESAEEAGRKIGESQQHFWTTETGEEAGAHITEMSKDEFIDDPESAGGNLLAKSDGIYIRDGLTNKAAFTAVKCVVGEEKPGKVRTEITDTGMNVIHNNARNEEEIWALIGEYFTFGSRANSVPGGFSFVTGSENSASGLMSFAEGYSTRASGDQSHAQNIGTIADSDAQTAIGKYNIRDNNDTFALIIGNGTGGTVSDRSNAAAVTWAGSIISTAMAGTVILTAAQSIPDGYIECDGQAVSRSTYTQLFDAIGTTYGAGDGSATFNVPNLSSIAPTNMKYIIHTGFYEVSV